MHPQPHRLSRRATAVTIASVLVFASVWFFSLITFASEPRPIAPVPVSGSSYVQALIEARTFSTTTSELSIRLSLRASSDLVNSRGLLLQPLALRVTDSQGASVIRFQSGDPLASQDVIVNMDGSANQYPFDSYTGSFSLEAEVISSSGAIHPVILSLGTQRARSGWNTSYSISRSASTVARITVIAMKREDFTIAFSLMLSLLMVILTVMALLVGVLCVTNQRESSPSMVSWLVALLFAIPFVRSILPGSPPLGCLFDVVVFAWCIALTMLAVLLSMVAWIRQSSATLHAQRATHTD